MPLLLFSDYSKNTEKLFPHLTLVKCRTPSMPPIQALKP